MGEKTWNTLAPRTRGLIVTVGAVEGVLKIAALVDVARRPAGQVRGSKLLWIPAIVLINSAGAAPLAYFRYGRRSR